jgi:hypothetical protein
MSACSRAGVWDGAFAYDGTAAIVTTIVSPAVAATPLAARPRRTWNSSAIPELSHIDFPVIHTSRQLRPAPIGERPAISIKI